MLKLEAWGLKPESFDLEEDDVVVLISFLWCWEGSYVTRRDLAAAGETRQRKIATQSSTSFWRGGIWWEREMRTWSGIITREIDGREEGRKDEKGAVVWTSQKISVLSKSTSDWEGGLKV